MPNRHLSTERFIVDQDTVRVFDRIIILLQQLGEDLGGIVRAGDLNAAQLAHMRLAVQKVDGLEQLFVDERARQVAPVTQES